MTIDGHDKRLISSGQGRTTCAHYTPDGRSIVYASTHLAGAACPPVPSMAQGYVWPIYDSYDIFRIGSDGSASHPSDEHARLRRGGDHREGRAHCLHERARRRHGDLLDERRRVRRASADESSRPRRRAVLFRRRIEDRLPRPAPAARRRARRLPQPAEEGDLAADQTRPLRDEPRRQQPRAGHEARRGELRAVLHARRQARSSSRRTSRTRRAATSISTSSTKTAPESSRSPTARRSTASRCSRRTAGMLVFASNRNQAKEGDTNVFIAEWKD